MQADVRLRPLEPALHAEMALEGHKKGVVIQPLVLLGKTLHGLPVPGISGTERLVQHVKPGLVDLPIVHIARLIAPVDRLQLRTVQKAVLRQQLQVNEVGVSGKGGEALIGAVAVAGGPQGQQLPVFLACRVEKVRKGVGLPAQGTDAVPGGEGGNMQENTAMAVHKQSLFPFRFRFGLSFIIPSVPPCVKGQKRPAALFSCRELPLPCQV